MGCVSLQPALSKLPVVCLWLDACISWICVVLYVFPIDHSVSSDFGLMAHSSVFTLLIYQTLGLWLSALFRSRY